MHDVQTTKIGPHKVTWPIVWLGQSVRTTLITAYHQALINAPIMASLGDAVHRPRLIPKVFENGLRSRLKTKGPILLDSGGYTLWRMDDSSLKIERLAKIYEATEADLTIALDLPPSHQDDEEIRLAKYATTLTNLEFLTNSLDPKRLVPVVHGNTMAEVESNARAVSALIPRPLAICLGGLVPLFRRSGKAGASLNSPIRFLAKAVSTVRSVFPNALLHLLGAGSPRTVVLAFAVGADSTDSIGWRRAAGFGTIFLPGKGERFVAPAKRQRAGSRPLLSESDLTILSKCRCPVCGQANDLQSRVAQLAACYRARSAHNAWILLQEARGFAEAEARNRVSEYIAGRLPDGWLLAIEGFAR